MTNKEGHIWVRIGGYGTPKPYWTWMMNENISKQCFKLYRNTLIKEIGNDKIEEDDYVKVLSYEDLGAVSQPSELFFQGTYKEAVEWASEYYDPHTIKKEKK